MTIVFMLANSLVLPIWASMILAPRSRWTARLMARPWYVLPLLAAYAALIVPNLASVLPVVAQPELAAVAQLLGSPLGAAAAWLHFLAFDLWIGRFIVLDARDREIPGVVLSAIVAITLLLAPIGLGAYLALRNGLLQRAWSALQGAARASWRGSVSLTWLGIVSGVTAVVTSALQLIDPRQTQGVSLWLKPTKFGVSIAILAFTLAFLAQAIDMPLARKRRAESTIAAGLILELAIISLQAARGVASHFNFTSTLNSTLFTAMGIAIVAVTIAIGDSALHAFRTRYENAALGAGVRGGFALTILGCLLAFLMISPTARQLASLQRGEPTTVIGGHTIGGSETSSGMPLTRWSDSGGDLRVPHFIGLHAMQIMPMLGFWLSRRRRLSAQQAHRLTRIAGWGYLGVIGTTLVQALRAQPLLAPDAFTCGLAAVVAVSCVMAAGRVVMGSSERKGLRRSWQHAVIAR